MVGSASTFDGTLAVYDRYMGLHNVGKPVPAMLDRVKHWLDAGIDVRIVTARANQPDPSDNPVAIRTVEKWCFKHLGRKLPVVASKDYRMSCLWDDRAVQVETNSGRVLGVPLGGLD